MVQVEEVERSVRAAGEAYAVQQPDHRVRVPCYFEHSPSPSRRHTLLFTPHARACICSGTPSGTPTASAALRGKVSPKPARVAATSTHVVATERPVKIAVAIVLTNEAKTVRCLLQSFFGGRIIHSLSPRETLQGGLLSGHRMGLSPTHTIPSDLALSAMVGPPVSREGPGLLLR